MSVGSFTRAVAWWPGYPARMTSWRARGLVLAVWFATAVAGCFSPGDDLAAPTEESSALAATLLGTLGVKNANWVDEPLPVSEATAIHLSAVPGTLDLQPLAANSLAVTALGLPQGVRVAALLLSWPGADRYLAVPRTSTSADPKSRFEIQYSVDERACTRLCDRVHRADLVMSVALSDGRVVAQSPFGAKLDCRQDGNPALCDIPADSPALVLGRALEGYRARYCECQGLDCAADELGFGAECALDGLLAQPEAGADIARCMADRLVSATQCLSDTCDVFTCASFGSLFDMGRQCGLVQGGVNDAMLECFLSSRSNAAPLPCNQGFSVHPSSFCDGSQDCEGAFDEMTCPLGIQCDEFFEVPPAWVCNGFSDCATAVDELECQDVSSFER